MRRSAVVLALAFVAIPLFAQACGGSSDQPPQQPTATAYPPGYQAPPPGYQQPAPQPGYQQPAPQPGYQQPAPQPGQPGAAPTAGGQMSTPGPMAFACQNDSACGTHRCNTQFQKCAFPCATPVDCAAGNQCLMGVCAPKPPGTP